ncbi:MAG: asparagine synthase (glutamine-hydrolyzing), partial [Chloroflexota bacterium]
MCGITGFWKNEGASELELVEQVRQMSCALIHRGPDASGEWADEAAGIAMGSRRLAIIDVSPAGHQPMVSANGRYVLSYNGEVYNHVELCSELKAAGVSFRGHSDTEVILEAINAWGLQAAVKRFVGMFAYALWERQTRRLSLVRDRLGIKPMYYGWMGSTLMYGSELKALRTHPDFVPEVDRTSLTLFMRYSVVPAPYSIYTGIRQLEPGVIATFHSPHEREPHVEKFWSMEDVAREGQANPFNGTEAEAIDELDALLREAVSLRMISDVPLGGFLSGGIDSSTVIAMMQTMSSRPVKTFSIGFEEQKYDESDYARKVAEHLGTDHTQMIVTSDKVLKVLPRLPEIFDEPFSDWSQVPTYLLSRLARHDVTVSLSGDGGDELFAGYTHYMDSSALYKMIHPVPPALRRLAGRGLEA